MRHIQSEKNNYHRSGFLFFFFLNLKNNQYDNNIKNIKSLKNSYPHIRIFFDAGKTITMTAILGTLKVQEIITNR